MLAGIVSASDIPGRLGGDEFALLLPNMNAQAAFGYVEKLQKQLLAAMNDKDWPVTFSMGIACYQVVPSDFDTLIRQADSLMYEAKRNGGNRMLHRELRHLWRRRARCLLSPECWGK